jgi:ankyrin repeat protein
MAQKIDSDGCNPLHYACKNGHLEITKILLRHDLDLTLIYNNKGFKPLHLAAIHGNGTILEEFLAMAPTSFDCLTTDGDNVFHLLVRFNAHSAFMCLEHVFGDTKLFQQPDQFGNTILHIAISGGLYHVWISLSLSLSLSLSVFFLGTIEAQTLIMHHYSIMYTPCPLMIGIV